MRTALVLLALVALAIADIEPAISTPSAEDETATRREVADGPLPTNAANSAEEIVIDKNAISGNESTRSPPSPQAATDASTKVPDEPLSTNAPTEIVIDKQSTIGDVSTSLNSTGQKETTATINVTNQALPASVTTTQKETTSINAANVTGLETSESITLATVNVSSTTSKPSHVFTDKTRMYMSISNGTMIRNTNSTEYTTAAGVSSFNVSVSELETTTTVVNSTTSEDERARKLMAADDDTSTIASTESTATTTTIDPSASTTPTTSIDPSASTAPTTPTTPTTTTIPPVAPYDCSFCDARVYDMCVSEPFANNRTCTARAMSNGRMYRCREGARKGGPLCDQPCPNCAYETDYCDKDLNCITMDDKPRELMRCVAGFGGPKCDMPCNSTCNNQCSYMSSYNKTNGTLGCDHDSFACQEPGKQFFYADVNCRRACRKQNDPYVDCSGFCFDTGEKGIKCYDLWNSTTTQIPVCPLSAYTEPGATQNCTKSCTHCGPDAYCNAAGQCTCRHDITKCELCLDDLWSQPDCKNATRCDKIMPGVPDLGGNQGKCGPEGYCDAQGQCLCMFGIDPRTCKRCAKGWDGPKCDQVATTTPAATTEPSTTEEPTSTYPNETMATTTDEPTTKADEAPALGSVRQWVAPLCDEFHSQLLDPPSSCQQLLACKNGTIDATEAAKLNCTPWKRDCEEDDYEYFYCYYNTTEAPTTTLAPLIPPDETWWFVAAIALGVVFLLLNVLVIVAVLYIFFSGRHKSKRISKADKKKSATAVTTVLTTVGDTDERLTSREGGGKSAEHLPLLSYKSLESL